LAAIAAGDVGAIELSLLDGSTVRILPRIEVSDETGPLLGRLQESVEDPLRVPRSDLVDPLTGRSGTPYRTRPTSHADLWALVRDPNAMPDALAAALAGIGAEVSQEERDDLAAMSEATAHPQVRAIMRAVSAGESVAAIERLAREARRKPVRMT
jgi:hypothetical protein